MKAALTFAVALLLIASASVLADEKPDTWLAAAEKEAAAAEAKAKAPPEPVPQGDGPPLPLHTIEGVGGALAVPMAYLVNPGPEGTVCGKPAVSFTYLFLGTKSLQSIAVTETLYRRIELGYALNRFDLGNLPHVVKKATRGAPGGALKLHRGDVYLHHFNARALLIEENTKVCGIPLPAIVAGAHLKVNGGIMGIDETTKSLFPTGAFSDVGLERRNGIDYVVTASKMFPTLMFGRPLILTAGVRNSQASNFGLTGFGDECSFTFEGDAVCLVTDWLAVGYEFRGRNNPYDEIPGLLGDETNLHAIRVGLILSDRLTLAAGWACLGPVGNSVVDCCVGVQVKYEF